MEQCCICLDNIENNNYKCCHCNNNFHHKCICGSSFLHLFSVTFAYCAHSYAYFLLALLCCIGWVLFVDDV